MLFLLRLTRFLITVDNFVMPEESYFARKGKLVVFIQVMLSKRIVDIFSQF